MSTLIVLSSTIDFIFVKEKITTTGVMGDERSLSETAVLQSVFFNHNFTTTPQFHPFRKKKKNPKQGKFLLLSELFISARGHILALALLLMNHTRCRYKQQQVPHPNCTVLQLFSYICVTAEA